MLNRRRNVGFASVQPARIAAAIASACRAPRVAAPHPAARVAAVEDEAGDPLGMTSGVDQRDRRALRDAEQREAVDARRVDDGLEVGDPGVDGELAELAIGEPAPSLVVADERVAVAQLGQPVAPHRALPVEVQMRQPRRHPHDRRPAAVDGVAPAARRRRRCRSEPAAPHSRPYSGRPGPTPKRPGPSARHLRAGWRPRCP